MWGVRWIAAAVVGAAVVSTAAGCSSSGWCRPLEPGPTVTASYAPTADRLATLPGVTDVDATYRQPDDSHCVSRKSLQNAPWSADFTVHVRSGFTLEQVDQVRAALGSSTATVHAARGDGVAAWELALPASRSLGSTPSPGDPPLVTDADGYRLVTEAALLPGVTVAQQGATAITIRVRTPASVAAAVAWLRAHVTDPTDSWVYVGTSTSWTLSTGVTGLFGVADTTIATATGVLEAHPGITRLNVGGTLVTAVAPTEADAEDVVAAFERTDPDRAGQTVAAWWPDGNGTKVSGAVGSAR